MADDLVLKYYEKRVKLETGLDVVVKEHGDSLIFIFEKYPKIHISFFSNGLTIDAEVINFIQEIQCSHPELKAAQALKSGIQGFLLK